MTTPPGQSEMRCRKCGYDLRGLDEHRCPECNTAFDPKRAETYLTKPKSGMRALVWSIVAVVWFAWPWVCMHFDLTNRTDLPVFVQFLLMGPACVGMLGGMTIACVVLEYVWKPLRSGTWVRVRWALVAGAILSGGLLAIFWIMMIRSLLRSLLN